MFDTRKRAQPALPDPLKKLIAGHVPPVGDLRHVPRAAQGDLPVPVDVPVCHRGVGGLRHPVGGNAERLIDENAKGGAWSAFPAPRQEAAHGVVGNLRALVFHLTRQPDDVPGPDVIRIPCSQRRASPSEVLVGCARRHHVRQFPCGESVETRNQLMVLVRRQVVGEPREGGVLLLRHSGAEVGGAGRAQSGGDGEAQVEALPRLGIGFENLPPVLQHAGVDGPAVVVSGEAVQGRAGQQHLIHESAARHDPLHEGHVLRIGFGISSQARFVPHFPDELPLGQGADEGGVAEQGLHPFLRDLRRIVGHFPLQPCRELSGICGQIPRVEGRLPISGVGLPRADSHGKGQQRDAAEKAQEGFFPEGASGSECPPRGRGLRRCSCQDVGHVFGGGVFWWGGR